MPFTKFVEVGRIVYIAFGPDAGKICAIVDIIDQNRALVEGPVTRVRRQPCSFKRLHLTKFKIDFQHSSRQGVVKKAWEDEKISEKWAETSWAKRIQAKKLRARINDFERFKLMKAKQARNKTIKREYNKLKRKSKKLTEKPKPKVLGKAKTAPVKSADAKPKGKKEGGKAEGKPAAKAEGKAAAKSAGKPAAPKKETKKAEKPAKK